jgi:3-hydroxybutyrate dehydrogenase
MDLSNKTALITGAGSGIGRAIAEKFARHGAQVILHDVTPDTKKIAASLDGAFVAADLADPDAVRELASAALRAASNRIDILVNNAGFQHVAPIEDFPEEVWMRMIQVLLVAPFQLIKRLLPGMKERGWGRIINVASIHGLVASSSKSAYVSAKHGLVGLTKTVALEAGAFGVTVNAICPAYVRTPLVEKQIAEQARVNAIKEEEVIDKIMLEPAAIKRLIDPEEVADFALYLASDQARSITGAAHLLDLGWTAR